MNSEPKPTPASPLFLAVTVPHDPVFQMIWPDNNLIGTTLLKLLLQEKLQTAGVLADGIIGHLASGLNASFFASTTDNKAEAVKHVRAILKTANMEGFARIYSFDQDELVLRCLFPASGDVVSASAFAATDDPPSVWITKLMTAIQTDIAQNLHAKP